MNATINSFQLSQSDYDAAIASYVQAFKVSQDFCSRLHLHLRKWWDGARNSAQTHPLARYHCPSTGPPRCVNVFPVLPDVSLTLSG